MGGTGVCSVCGLMQVVLTEEIEGDTVSVMVGTGSVVVGTGFVMVGTGSVMDGIGAEVDWLHVVSFGVLMMANVDEL